MSVLLKSSRFSRIRGPLCFVGDIHGNLDRLKNVWGKLPAAFGSDKAFEKGTVVFLGDYCDKGPDTKGVIDFLVGLKEQLPLQNHYFLSGNHDFALSSFLGILPEHGRDLVTELGLNKGDYSDTWKKGYESRVEGEELYDGPGYEKMHLQGRRYAAGPESIFESEETFRSYGVPYADREALLKAMPTSHALFFSNLNWLIELRSNVGDVVAVHAGKLMYMFDLVSLPLIFKQVLRIRLQQSWIRLSSNCVFVTKACYICHFWSRCVEGRTLNVCPTP
mmetsp:Transcript_31641/g.50524  ORF Transcript_31641/g.50524 Transcript_31641/m.50524 type:complete len:277 (+) Transcript_31641:2277-3107(+)